MTTVSVGVTRLKFTDDRVIKQQDRALAQIEYEKTCKAVRIGRSTGLFRVPEVIAFDTSAGLIEFRRIDELWTLRRALRGGDEASRDRLMTTLGRSLAALHDRPAPGRRDPDLDFGVELSTPAAFVHGDVTPNNVCVDADSGRLVILDWQPANWLAVRSGGNGPCYLDLCMMTLTLFLRTPVSRQPIPQPARRARVLLDAYCSASPGRFAADEFQRYFGAVLRRYCAATGNWRFTVRKTALYPSIWRAKKFVDGVYAERSKNRASQSSNG